MGVGYFQILTYCSCIVVFHFFILAEIWHRLSIVYLSLRQ